MSEPEKIFHAVFNELAQLKTMGAWHSLALLSIAQEIGQQQLAAHSKDATVTLAKRGKWRLESGKRQTANGAGRCACRHGDAAATPELRRGAGAGAVAVVLAAAAGGGQYKPLAPGRPFLRRASAIVGGVVGTDRQAAHAAQGAHALLPSGDGVLQH